MNHLNHMNYDGCAGRRPRRKARVVQTALCVALIACALVQTACSSPLDRTGGDEQAVPQYKSQLPSEDRIASLETIAKRFVVCLTDKGIDARLGDTLSLSMDGTSDPLPQTTVLLRMLGADGNPVGVDADGLETDTSASALYPGVSYSKTDTSGSWIAVADSSGLAGTPYAGKQGDYSTCEQTNPDFAQPPLSGDASRPKPNPDMQRNMLEFARKARAKGFDWMKDPEPDDMANAITVPDDLSAEEFRRFLTEFPPSVWPDSISGIMIPSSRGDLSAIRNEASQ